MQDALQLHSSTAKRCRILRSSVPGQHFAVKHCMEGRIFLPFLKHRPGNCRNCAEVRWLFSIHAGKGIAQPQNPSCLGLGFANGFPCAILVLPSLQKLLEHNCSLLKEFQVHICFLGCIKHAETWWACHGNAPGRVGAVWVMERTKAHSQHCCQIQQSSKFAVKSIPPGQFRALTGRPGSHRSSASCSRAKSTAFLPIRLARVYTRCRTLYLRSKSQPLFKSAATSASI